MQATTLMTPTPGARFLKNSFFILLVLVLPLQSMAWGLIGHRVVGEIAESYLSPKAKLEIHKILGNESLAMAANWADFIKSDPSYSYLSSWHYIDFDGQFTYPELKEFLKKDTATDAYTKMLFMVSELKKKNLPKDKKLLYLRLIIHIAGDLHQPMHAAHTADKGGNGLRLSWFGQATNLHAVWDSNFIDDQKLSFSEYAKAINFTTPQQRAAWQKEELSKWVFDTHIIAEGLYKEVKAGDNLTYKYGFDHLDILNTQLLKGGVHLAGLLNSIFA